MASIYDRIFGRIIFELEKQDAIKLPSATFFDTLRDDFQSIDNLLSKGILAAYLLGYDESKEENQQKLKADFADDDKSAGKAGLVDLRFDVAPTEAIDYFKRKKIVTEKTFNSLDREAKAGSFYVSGIYREDVLEAFKFEITNALETGQTSKYLTERFKEILDGANHKELGNFHLETIARSSMLTAYGVGRRTQMEETSDLLPFWQRNAVSDDRTRPKHRALDGIIYPANHEFWDDHFCPDDFNCRCSITALLDYPSDYDHLHPNSETTIAYDEKGLPAKAEYLTQVVDLKATDFVGVPKTANLEKTITEAAKAVKDSRLLNHQNIPQIVVDKAKELRRAKKETLAGWNKNGEFVGQFKGANDEVYIPTGIEKKLDGGFAIHNHPSEDGRFFEAPSDLDFVTQVELNLKINYVVTRNYLYQVRAPKNGWTENVIEKFYNCYEKIRAKIAYDLSNKFRNQALTFEQIQDLERHLIWQEVAKELKFKYKRFTVSEL